VDSFDKYWERIVVTLRPMDEMHAWSREGRARSRFGIVEVKGGGVTVRTGNGLRSVPRKDFEVIFRLWRDYKKGKVQRQELRELSQNTTYVLGIFHWIESQVRPEVMAAYRRSNEKYRELYKRLSILLES
jgi:hypothetical protein